MIIPHTDLQSSVTTLEVVMASILHKPTGLVGYGEDKNNSRKAYAYALKELEFKLENNQPTHSISLKLAS